MTDESKPPFVHPGAHNDNDTPKQPEGLSANDGALTLEQQLSHGIMQLALHERSIRRFVLVSYPTGEKEPLGELLMRIGAHLFEDRETEAAEAPRPKLRLVPLAAPSTGLSQMADLVKSVAKDAVPAAIRAAHCNRDGQCKDHPHQSSVDEPPPEPGSA